MSTNEMLKDINGTILQKGQFVSYSPTTNNGIISFGVVYDNTHIINSDGKKLIPYKLVCLDENGVYNKQYNKTVAAINAFDANLQHIKSMERIKAKDLVIGNIYKRPGEEYHLYQYFGKGKVTYKCRTKHSYTSSWSTAEWSKEVSKEGYICILIYKYKEDDKPFVCEDTELYDENVSLRVFASRPKFVEEVKNDCPAVLFKNNKFTYEGTRYKYTFELELKT